MKNHEEHALHYFLPGFIFKIVLPSSLAIVLFVIAIYAIIIPAFEDKIVDDKKEMIRELTDTAWSVLDEYSEKEEKGEWSLTAAQKSAVERVQGLRYGKEHKGYFWITDLEPRMIVHPYRHELEKQNLKEFSGFEGRRLFVEFAALAKSQGSGYIKYRWQWMDDPERIEPKLSYVKIFKPWNWIIGTGIYLDDVKAEIAAMERRVLIISGTIIFITILLLLLVSWQSLKTAKGQVEAELELNTSREKYKALVHASTEGLIMLLDGKLSHANDAVLKMLGFKSGEFAELPMFNSRTGQRDISDAGKYFHALISGEEVPARYETQFERRDGVKINVVLANSAISFNGLDGHIVIVNDISHQQVVRQEKIEDEQHKMIIELQASLLYMEQSLNDYSHDPVYANMHTSVHEIAELMKAKKCRLIVLTSDRDEIAGVVTYENIVKRCVAGKLDLNMPALKIMNSPPFYISDGALVAEAILRMSENNIDAMIIKNSTGAIIGTLYASDLLHIQSSSSAALQHAIENAQNIEDITRSYSRLAHFVKVLVDTGINAVNITQLVALTAKTIHKRVIDMALAEVGPPPTTFAFITMGSEGREEETLITDQDNGIIFSDVTEAQLADTHAYFMRLSNIICGHLNTVGYRFCKGKIMAMNSRWCQPLSVWKNYFAEWITTADAENLLNFNIFFDFRCCYGEYAITDNLRLFIHDTIKHNPNFLLLFAQNCLLYKPPISLFGNIALSSSKSHASTFSIKEALKPVTNFARIYALENNLEVTNTLARIKTLHESGVLSFDSFKNLNEIYNCLMKIRFKHQALAIHEHRLPDNYINPAELTDVEQEMLKKVFAMIMLFQKKLSFHFKGTV